MYRTISVGYPLSSECNLQDWEFVSCNFYGANVLAWFCMNLVCTIYFQKLQKSQVIEYDKRWIQNKNHTFYQWDLRTPCIKMTERLKIPKHKYTETVTGNHVFTGNAMWRFWEIKLKMFKMHMKIKLPLYNNLFTFLLLLEPNSCKISFIFFGRHEDLC